MNPRGNQFGLAGALDAWVRRESFPPHEAAILRRCYAGREPRTFSRFGIRQWAAPLPRTRIVIKDPFAVLSIAAIHETAGALPVVLYRHPAAVLASYRRMGWTADAEEMAALGAPQPDSGGDLAAMAAMWSWCYDVALSDLGRIDGGLVVSHHGLTVGSAAAHRELCRQLSLATPASTSANGRRAGKRRKGVLHDFDRSATTIDEGWRAEMTADEIATMEELVAPTWAQLEKRQLPLPGPVSA